jgi:glycosyltransferase involved in cell wall biosynthesis
MARITRFRVKQGIDWCAQVTLQRPLSRSLVLVGLILRRLGFRRHGLGLLLAGRRVAKVPRADAAIRTILLEDPRVHHDLVAMFGESAHRQLSTCTRRILFLKVPRLEQGEVREKGALIIKFTETFAPFYLGLDLERVARYFRIILEPSWVGYSLPEILAWTSLSPEKVIVMAPYVPDHELIDSLRSNLVPTTLGPADWVNPQTFERLPGTEKVYDAIYVANYNPKKRVDRFLRAVVKVHRSRPDFRAAIVCAGVGRSDHGVAIRETIAWARSLAKIDFFDAVKQSELNVLLNQSKVNVLLSLREGMNKGLAEGLFAGAPALLLAESACGNHRHIHPDSGRVVPDRDLEKSLLWFAEHHDQFQTDQWARQQISPFVSIRALSQLLRDLEISEGSAWTRDLAPKANQPEMRYLEERDAWLNERRPGFLEAFALGSPEALGHAFVESLETELVARSERH